MYPNRERKRGPSTLKGPNGDGAQSCGKFHRTCTDTPEEGVALYVGTASLNGVARMAASAHRADVLGLPYVENTSAAYEPKENRLEKAASHPDVQGRLREETPRSCRSTLGGTRLRPSRSDVRCRR